MRKTFAFILCVLCCLCVSFRDTDAAGADRQKYVYLQGEKPVVYHEGYRMQGTAAWYGGTVHHRKGTSSGEIFDERLMTAAHRTFPFGTRVKVTNRRNGKSVVVTINDRGPMTRRFCIDLSRGAAMKINMVNSGVAPVDIEVLSLPEGYAGKPAADRRRRNR